MEKKLYRNMHDKKVAGVASGVADYLSLEVTIVRLLFVLATIFMAGAGVIAYIIIWVVAPTKFDPTANFSKFNHHFQTENNPPFNAQNIPNWNQPISDTQKDSPFETHFAGANFSKKSNTGRSIAGVLLIVAGTFFLLREFDLIPYYINMKNFWPIIFIVIGISIITSSKNKKEWKQWKAENEAKPATEDVPVAETEPIIVVDDNTTTPTENSDVDNQVKPQN